ncbi:uncharacterized protein [Panulirus ornatus]|uniref:uncharacterized protein isoform X2 n=1 Tax=Panulirus ornatus TaxID=150431 RepID=UPI003A8B28AC
MCPNNFYVGSWELGPLGRQLAPATGTECISRIISSTEMEKNVDQEELPIIRDGIEDIPTIDEEDSSQISSISSSCLQLLSSPIIRTMGNESETAQEELKVRRRHLEQTENNQALELDDTTDTKKLNMSDKSKNQNETAPIGEEKEVADTMVQSLSSNFVSQGSTNSPEDVKGDMARDGFDECYEEISSTVISTENTVDKLEDIVTHMHSSPPPCKYKDEESLCDTESESHLTINQMSGSEVQSIHDLSSLKKKSKTKKQKTHKPSKDSRDSDSSVSSKKRGSSNKTRIKSKFAPGSLEYIGERLCGRVFSGWVEERRWVEDLGGYRDVIEVDEWEVEMNQQLKVIISSFPGVYEGTKWINITPPGKSPCYCLWVLLAAPPAPGHYWYAVTGVHLQPQFGLRIVVKEIRSVHPHDGESSVARRKRQRKLSTNESSNELQTLGEQVQEWLEQVRQLNLVMIWSAVSSTITFSNIKETIRFLIVLVVTLAIGLVSFLRKSHHFLLHFVREAGNFFRNITPFLQSLLSFVEKLIGGMYLLIAMIYRDWRRPSVPPPPYPPSGQPPLSLTQGQSNVPVPPHHGPRVVKYVPQEHWVYRTQNS